MFKHAAPSILLIGLLTLGLAACGEDSGQETAALPQPDAGTAAGAGQGAPASDATGGSGWTGEIVETMNSGGYTYIHLDTGTEQIWAAAPQTEAAVGQRVAVPRGMLMRDFPSSTLDRTFPEIWFVSGFFPEGQMPGAGGGMGAGHGDMSSMGAGHGGGEEAHNVVADAAVEAVARAEGGQDVAGVYANSLELNGKTVKVRGRVVKFTANIMGTNWIHIQDGSGSGDTADLTVTSNQVVAVGDLVLIEGQLAVDKDFGAGYRYAAIIENATVTKE